MRTNPAFDTDGDLLIQRYRNGIRLVKPSHPARDYSTQTVSHLFNTPLSVYFYNSENVLINGNQGAVEIAGAESITDLRGTTVEKFIGKHLKTLVDYNNHAVLQTQALKIFEEAGTRLDDYFISVISFKFPWYYENTLIGLLGCSIKITPDSIQNIGRCFSALLSKGLLHPSETSLYSYQNTEFTPREISILKLLLRGKTAKEIGEQLSLSPRTIEHYIANMKIKSNCSSKSELIDKFLDEFYS